MSKRNTLPSMVTIGSFSGIAAASVARSKLEAAGIHCFLSNEHITRVQWLYSIAVGGLQLQVAQCDAQKAQELLNEPSINEEELINQALQWQCESDYYKAPSTCPACGSTDIKEEVKIKPLRALVLLIYMAMPLAAKNYYCNSCGKTWK